MRKRLLVALAALSALILAAGALPAFTDDSGTLNVSVSMAVPPSACVLFTGSSPNIDFGTQQFSRPGAVNTAVEDGVHNAVNCSTVGEHFDVYGTDATDDGPKPPLTWTLAGPVSCGAGSPLDIYGLGANQSNPEPGRVEIKKTPTGLIDLGHGATVSFHLDISLPCQGSIGAGHTFSSRVTVLATIL